MRYGIPRISQKSSLKKILKIGKELFFLLEMILSSLQIYLNDIIHANGKRTRLKAKNRTKHGKNTTPKYPMVTKNLFKCFFIFLGAGAQINPQIKLYDAKGPANAIQIEN